MRRVTHCLELLHWQHYYITTWLIITLFMALWHIGEIKVTDCSRRCQLIPLILRKSVSWHGLEAPLPCSITTESQATFTGQSCSFAITWRKIHRGTDQESIGHAILASVRLKAKVQWKPWEVRSDFTLWGHSLSVSKLSAGMIILWDDSDNKLSFIEHNIDYGYTLTVKLNKINNKVKTCNQCKCILYWQT